MNTKTESMKDPYDSKEIVADMVERYNAVKDQNERARAALVTQLHMELGKPEASIRGKLISEGVYVRKITVPKGIVRKTDIVDDIVRLMKDNFNIVVTDNEADSLAKPVKSMLLKLKTALASAEDLVAFVEDTSSEMGVDEALPGIVDYSSKVPNHESLTEEVEYKGQPIPTRWLESTE